MQLYLIHVDILNGVIQNHIDIYMLLHTCLSVVKVLNAFA